MTNKRWNYGKTTNPTLQTFRHSNQYIFSWVLLSSIISLIASFILSEHAITLAANKNASFSCNINAVVSCGKVGNSWQANAFGFPNAFIGLMFEPVICFIAILYLCKVSIPKQLMIIINAIYSLAVIFALWLFYESITSIHALCPYCLLVTLSTGIVFFNLLHINLRDNNFSLKEKTLNIAHNILDYYGILIAEITYVIIIIAIVLANYGSSLL